jgi:hypothetical protein
MLTINNYNVHELSQNEWTKDVNKHNTKYQQLKENNFITENELTELINNSYSFTLEIINSDPYYYKDSYLVEVSLTYINKPLSVYINKEVLNNYLQPKKSIHWYAYTLRGFSLGCQPKGFIEHNENIGRYGIIAYDRELTKNELYDYDLVPYEL